MIDFVVLVRELAQRSIHTHAAWSWWILRNAALVDAQYVQQSILLWLERGGTSPIDPLAIQRSMEVFTSFEESMEKIRRLVES